MKKSYVAIAVLITAILSVTYYFHEGKVDKARLQIEQLDKAAETSFLVEKEAAIKKFQKNYPNHPNIIRDYYSKSDANIVKDTTISTFVFFSSLPVSVYNNNYLSCLDKKAGLEVDKIVVKDRLETELGEMKKRHGDDVDYWLDQVGKQKLLNTSEGTSYCKSFFNTYQDYSLNRTALREFQDVVSEYRRDREASQSLIRGKEQEFLSDLDAVRNKLNYDGQTYLNNHLDKDEIIERTNREYTFTGEIIGSYEYTFPTKVYHRDKLETLTDQAVKEQYKNNSLTHGSKPYSYCFGSYNGCDGYNCSQLEVQASYSSDVVVTLKQNDRVVRHAYISEGRTYTFDVPNGRYQPFFYSGSGWNPHKHMKETTCGTLKGGFVSGGHVGKDSPQYLSNQILTYELIEQIDGNFQTSPSSTNEAF